MAIGTALRRGAGRVAARWARKAREVLRRKKERPTKPNRGGPKRQSDTRVAVKLGIAAGAPAAQVGYSVGDRIIEGREQRRAQEEARRKARTAALDRREQAARARLEAVKERTRRRQENANKK